MQPFVLIRWEKNVLAAMLDLFARLLHSHEDHWGDEFDVRDPLAS